MKNIRRILFQIRLTTDIRAKLYGALASMTGPAGGIPLGAALSEMEAEYRKQKHFLHPLLQEVMRRMKGGGSKRVSLEGREAQTLKLGDVLLGLVPNNEAMIIRSGEEQGNISLGLLQAAKYARSQSEIIKIIRSGVSRVLWYALMMSVIYYYFSLEIIPQMEQAAPRHRWTQAAQSFGFVADHIIAFIIGFFLFIAFIYWAFNYLKKNLTGPVRNFLDRNIWPFTTVRLLNSSATLGSLSGFLRTGVPFRTAVNSISEGADRYMVSKLDHIKRLTQQGKPPHVSLTSCNLFPEENAWIISLYGRTSDFGQSLDHIANEFSELSIEKAKTTAMVADIMGTLAIAGSILWIAVTMYGIVGTLK
ncbi:type II secretion system F family protein [Delftia tsuruhatensis]|jgi:type II secretory pathway component PulF|uniref:type II secretion system F family protein n=1 Tax=Delftia tsuruhatensis TaxID=180282 RepID=UPI00289F53C4|nr:type II secretion system F family protein [Delftia tsuruhatensis]